MGDGREHMTPGRGTAVGAEMDDAGATNAAVGKRTLTEGAGVGANSATTIGPLMAAIEQNEGMITGVEIARSS